MIELNEIKKGMTLYYYEPYQNMVIKVRVRGVSEDAGIVYVDCMGAIPQQLLFKSRKCLVRFWMFRLMRDKENCEKKQKWTEKVLENIKRMASLEDMRHETICETCLRSCKDIGVMTCEGHISKEEQ